MHALFSWPPTPQKLVVAGIGVLILIVGLVFWISAIKRDARDLAIAEEKDRGAKVLEEENQKRERERQIEREQTAKLIASNKDLTDKLVNTVAARSQESALLRAALLAPKTAEQVVRDSEKNLGITPVVQDGSFRLTQEQFQELIAVKVDRDTLKLNNEDLARQVRLTQDTVARLTLEKKAFEDSLREKDTLIASQRSTIDAYAKVAKRGKWRRFGSAIGKVGLAVLPAVAVGLVLR
jgi:hypothetical protein